MLKIDKKPFSKAIMADIQNIKRTCNWDEIADEDNESKRYAFDMLDKEMIREHLVGEQHGLCAYCMKRISNDGSATTIDHRNPLNEGKDNVFDYHNLYATCKGGRDVDDRNKVLCCEALKGEQKITINPEDKHQMDKIRYNRMGMIYTYPKDVDLEKDINDVLGLNGRIDTKGNMIADTSNGLVKGRRDSYNKYVSYVEGLNKKRKLRKHVIEKRIRELESMDTYGEYAGVMLYFLNQKIRGL